MLCQILIAQGYIKGLDCDAYKISTVNILRGLVLDRSIETSANIMNLFTDFFTTSVSRQLNIGDFGYPRKRL